MNILDKAIAFVAPNAAVHRMVARWTLKQFSYDGARFTNERNNASSNINPNDFSKQRDRLQLMREAEDLEDNFAPAKTLNRKYAMYVAPTSYHAQTGDNSLNADLEEYLNEIAFPNADVTNRFDFFKMLEFGVIGKNRGGDYGWSFMRPGIDEGMNEKDIVKLPLKIQAVEPDRLGGIYQNTVSNNYVGGVIIGVYGEPIAFRVFKRGLTIGQYTDPVDVPAAQFVHYTDPLRLDMYRSVSMLDAAVANLRDLYEMINFLKGKAKLASALTVFTNSIGAVAGNGAMDPYLTSAFPNNQSGLQQDIKFGQINHMLGNSEIRFPDTNSPGDQSQFLMIFLMKLIAMSYNLPYSFALDAAELGGVSSRLESEQARAEFERGQGVLRPHANRIKNALIVDAMAKGIFSTKHRNVILKGRWGYRPHPTPDIGKEAQASVSFWQNGLLNPIKFFSDTGENAESVARDMARWASIKKQSAEAEGHTVEEVFGNGPIAPGTQTQEQQKPKSEAELEEGSFSKLSREERDYIVSKMKDLVDKGYDKDQAFAIAYKDLKKYGANSRFSTNGKI